METKIKRIAFTSDGKRKSTQKTLRNLLADQLPDNNFISLQSQRIGTAIRPTTMYNERVRRQLYPEQSLKAKKNIEMRLLTSKQDLHLVRNKSENLRQFSPSQQKEYQSVKPMWVSREQKTKMKKCLGRVNLLAQKNITLEEQEQLDVIFEFLDCVAMNENYYQQAFTYLTDRLKRIIFVDMHDMDSQAKVNFRKVAEIATNQHIISSIYKHAQQRVTFKQLIQHYVNQILSMSDQAHKLQNVTVKQLQDLQQLIAQKQTLISKLTLKLNYYQTHPSENKYPQLILLQQQSADLKHELDEQLYRISVLNHNLELLHQTKLMNENKIDALKRQIANYELEKQSNVNKVQKSSELKLFEDNVKMLKEMLDRSIIRMGGMKEEYDKLKAVNDNLAQERDKLARRAAVGFSELTPRPNLKKIFETHNMNLNEVFDLQAESPSKKAEKQKKLPSTEKFVETLIGKFKNYYETYKVQEKEKQTAFELAVANRKNKKQKEKEKEKEKDVFDMAMDEAYEAKVHIKKTMQSVEEVKTAYKKKQQELMKK